MVDESDDRRSLSGCARSFYRDCRGCGRYDPYFCFFLYRHCVHPGDASFDRCFVLVVYDRQCYDPDYDCGFVRSVVVQHSKASYQHFFPVVFQYGLLRTKMIDQNFDRYFDHAGEVWEARYVRYSSRGYAPQSPCFLAVPNFFLELKQTALLGFVRDSPPGRRGLYRNDVPYFAPSAWPWEFDLRYDFVVPSDLRRFECLVRAQKTTLRSKMDLMS